MDRAEWQKKWDDRSLRYAKRKLDDTRTIAIMADEERLGSFPMQIALICAGNLLGRMSNSIVLAFPDVKLNKQVPLLGETLHEAILNQMRAAQLNGTYEARELQVDDYQFVVGGSSGSIVDGSGWNAYIGPAPSPIEPSDDDNFFGLCLAVIFGASHIFQHGSVPVENAYCCNAFDWSETIMKSGPRIKTNIDVGSTCFIGAGAVGSAAMYFLALLTRRVDATIFDMDHIEVENLDRSPLYCADDVDVKKAIAARNALERLGWSDVIAEPKPIHLSDRWTNRNAGTPDLVISAANELDARYFVEMNYPPLQIYATTGANWQTTLFRHAPGDVSCSLCAFPPDPTKPKMKCATDQELETKGAEPGEPQIDASLPFLSFAAGLMTAAEIAKASLPEFPFQQNKVALYFRPNPMLWEFTVKHRDGCDCEHRDTGVHRAMITGTKYYKVGS